MSLSSTANNPRNSSASTKSSPPWAAPRHPLPPYRLAKIANALGVSTPIPALRPCANFACSSSSHLSSAASASSECLHRSPTPGAGSAHSSSLYPSSTSKFLLHVVPPPHLPHDSDFLEGSDPSPPPPNASGYHVHFRRGTLVPIHPTLQSQLGAIAKEYALPSTAGMMLYLIPSSPPRISCTSHGLEVESESMPAEEPGPRLSEEIWKHLWVRVVRTEREEAAASSSRSSTPHLLGLGMSLGNRSSPYLPHSVNGHAPPQPLVVPRPSLHPIELSHPRPIAYPLQPEPLSPSSGSDMRSHTKSAPPSSSSVSTSEPGTPDTSLLSQPFEDKDAARADALDLPGLHSPAFVPVLAKVEFEIDRRKAAWYEPWLRSRRLNHEKRTASRKRTLSAESRKGEEGDAKKAPLGLTLAGKTGPDRPAFLAAGESKINLPLDQEQVPAVSLNGSPSVNEEGGPDDVVDTDDPKTPVYDEGGPEDIVDTDDLKTPGYERLPDDADDSGSDAGDERESEEAITRPSSLNGTRDPLVDVFGTDEDTWADIRAHSEASKPQTKPEVVELALSGADLAALPLVGVEDGDNGPGDVEDVQAMLNRMSQSSPMLDAATSMVKRRASGRASVSSRRPVPPPLILHTLNAPVASGGSDRDGDSPTGESTHLPYLRGTDVNGNNLAVHGFDTRHQDKRDGGVFDNIDLGLTQDEYDCQHRFKSKLDEIEKTLAQFSPQGLKSDESHQLGPQSTDTRTVSSPPSSLQVEEVASHISRSRSTDTMQEIHSTAPQDAQWPAVPASALSNIPTLAHHPPRSSSRSAPHPAPPQFAVNGVTTAPKQFMQPNSENELRRLEANGQGTHYAGFVQPLQPPNPSFSISPIIPLSPDPFGRFSSSEPQPLTVPRVPAILRRERVRPPPLVTEDTTARNSVASSIGGVSSRFSADSSTADEATPTTRSAKGMSMVSVKGFKKLWRKSQKSIDIVSTPTSPPPPTPTLSSPPVPARSSIQLSRFLPGVTAHEQPASLIPPKQKRMSSSTPPPPVPTRRPDSLTGKFHFDQESPYPVYSLAARPPAHTNNYPPSSRASMSLATDSPPLARAALPPPTEKDKDKTIARKSILKWKTSTSSLQQGADKRGSYDGRKMRRPSIVSLGGAARGSIVSSDAAAAALPPLNPAVPPEHHHHHHHNARGVRAGGPRATVSSADSASSARRTPPPSPSHLQAGPGVYYPSSERSQSVLSTHSGDSDDRSFDASQFEMVSPRMMGGPVLIGHPYQAS